MQRQRAIRMTARGAEVANGAAEKACMSRRVAQRYRREFRDR
ncbi:hypothetical protein ACVQEP_23605 [Enterobacter mori]|nr:hypothetical protein [Enterobacter mori]